MFKDKTIEKRVMTAVRAAIEQAQTSYESEVESAEAELHETIENLHAKHATRVDSIVESAVRNVFSALK